MRHANAFKFRQNWAPVSIFDSLFVLALGSCRSDIQMRFQPEVPPLFHPLSGRLSEFMLHHKHNDYFNHHPSSLSATFRTQLLLKYNYFIPLVED